MGDRRKRRRSWPLAEKQRIVAETLVAGVSVSVVARRYDVNANQVFKWRRELAAGDRAGLPAPACEFVPIGVFAEVEGKARAAQGDDGRLGAPAARSGLMEIDLLSGIRLRVDASVDERALGRVLRALRQAGRSRSPPAPRVPAVLVRLLLLCLICEISSLRTSLWTSLAERTDAGGDIGRAERRRRWSADDKLDTSKNLAGLSWP